MHLDLDQRQVRMSVGDFADFTLLSTISLSTISRASLKLISLRVTRSHSAFLPMKATPIARASSL